MLALHRISCTCGQHNTVEFFHLSHDGWLIFLRRVLMPLWTQTRPCRYLRRKLRSGLVPRSSPCSKTGPELNSITMSCISPVSAESTSAYLWLSTGVDFEYGRLLACRGDKEGARVQLDLVMSGKPLEVNAAGRKGKYSLEVRRCGSLFLVLTDRLYV